MPQPLMPQAQAPLQRNTFPYDDPLLRSPKDDPLGTQQTIAGREMTILVWTILNPIG
jgi:hypothetical protein